MRTSDRVSRDPRPPLRPSGRRAPVPRAEPRLIGGSSAAIEWGRLMVLVLVVAFAAAPFVGFLTSLSAVTVVAFAAALFGFGRPAVGVLGVTLLCTLDPLIRHFLLTTGGLLRWNTFNYWLLIVMVLSMSFVWRLADPHSRLLKVFVVLLVSNLVLSPSLTMGVQHVLGIVTLFGLLVYFAQADENPDLWYMVGVVNGAAGAAGGLAYLLLKDALPEINTNAWALFPEAAVFATCLGFRAAASRPNGQWILSLLAGTNALWTFLSGSRGGILIVSIGLIYILLTMKRTSHRVVFVASSVVVATLALNTFSDMQASSLHRINKMLDEEESAASRTNGRSDLAAAGVLMFARHPFGVGTGGFAHAWAELGFVPGFTSFKRGEEFQAHSAWIKVLAENGAPGALLMVLYVFSFMWYGRKSATPGATSLGVFVTTALAVTFVSVEFQGKSVWMLAAGATAQFYPAEMRRCLAADLQRQIGKPRRLVRRAVGRIVHPGQAPAALTPSTEQA
ncbi:MAG: O-antigen ligase family protein [Acidobacteria bacterium]|nr:O-antigen ligase family protein [Acidobacteriota bacterium]